MATCSNFLLPVQDETKLKRKDLAIEAYGVQAGIRTELELNKN